MSVSYTVFIVYFFISIFFFNDTATTEIYTLSLHDALPISLDMLQERQDLRPGQVFRSQRGDLSLLARCHEAKKQSPGVAVCQYRAMRRISLLDEPFMEK